MGLKVLEDNRSLAQLYLNSSLRFAIHEQSPWLYQPGNIEFVYGQTTAALRTESEFGHLSLLTTLGSWVITAKTAGNEKDGYYGYIVWDNASPEATLSSDYTRSLVILIFRCPRLPFFFAFSWSFAHCGLYWVNILWITFIGTPWVGRHLEAFCWLACRQGRPRRGSLSTRLAVSQYTPKLIRTTTQLLLACSFSAFCKTKQNKSKK